MRLSPKKDGKSVPAGRGTCSRPGREQAHQAGKRRPRPARREPKILAAPAPLLDRNYRWCYQMPRGRQMRHRESYGTGGRSPSDGGVDEGGQHTLRTMTPHDCGSEPSSSGRLSAKTSALVCSLHIPWDLVVQNGSCSIAPAASVATVATTVARLAGRLHAAPAGGSSTRARAQ
jgi:hypothetical protein